MKEEIVAQGKALAKLDKEIADHEAAVEKASAALKETKARRKAIVVGLRMMVSGYRVLHPDETIDIPGLDEAKKPRTRGGGDGQSGTPRPKGETQKLILGALTSPRTPSQLSEVAGVSVAAIYAALKKLKDDGQVTSEGGLWRRTGVAAATSSPVSIARNPHRMETIERHPEGFMCPKCRQVRKAKLDFAGFDCKPR